VEFPQDGALTERQVKALEAELPPRPMPRLTGEEEEVSLSVVDPREFGQTEDGHMQEDDEDGGRGGQRVQCQNM
jgi:hypothetical protein